ncbi:hypothetical protein QYM36_020017 [Artemia franciscana]|uniref:ERAP1-like C-terminal domain-containing protein n=1 Tax=Artemia franciscana TaxID=6661 RepID=A0AA88H0H3_ARTSF|nr:hypothetical protein QYM36_020017 [Artemia franciscana]
MICSENTQHIVLHINDIDVHSETIKVSGEGVEDMVVNRTAFEMITQFFTIHLSGELIAGIQLGLSMSYFAKLNDGLGVTTDWWEMLWLNDGLATYLKFKGVDWVEHDMKMEQQYVNDAIYTWIICDNKVFEYYRVDYDEVNWDLLHDQLQNNHTQIDVINRAQIIDHALNLASANQIKKTYERALNITSYLKKEFDWLPWETLYNNFERLQNLLSGTEAGALLNSHIQRLALHLYEFYTFNEDPKDKALDLCLRKIAVRIACETNFAPCVEEAKNFFFNWTKGLEWRSQTLKNEIIFPTMGNNEDQTDSFSIILYFQGLTEDDLLGLTCKKELFLVR